MTISEIKYIKTLCIGHEKRSDNFKDLYMENRFHSSLYSKYSSSFSLLLIRSFILLTPY